MNIKMVGVLGAGVMGTGVSQALAQTGHKVILIDISESILGRASREIENGVRFNAFFKNKEKNQNGKDILEAIQFSTDYEALREVDFVIENVTEKWDIKKGVYERIDQICPENSVFAANTSAIPITRIASVTKRANRVIGMHFMNPVPVKKFVEVVRGYHTCDETVQRSKALLEEMGKEAIIVNDAPGFVSNRVLMLTINEAIFLIQDQVACVEDIDRLFRTCFGHAMGPLETADLIGLDTILFSIEVLYESFNDSKYRPCPLLKMMVNAGLYGKKSGKGFYQY